MGQADVEVRSACIRGVFMYGDAFLQALWTTLGSTVQTTAGWAVGAAGPAFGIFLGLFVGYQIWNTIFMEDHHDHDLDEEDFDESGASDEARDYWGSREDGREL